MNLSTLPRWPSNFRFLLFLPISTALFKPLDDFLRTSSVGEFFARLQMLRAFTAQLASGAVNDSSPGTKALATMLQGLWSYYSQVIIQIVYATGDRLVFMGAPH